MFRSNTDPSRPRSSRSIYERAATDGLWLGLYFTVLFLVSVASMRVALLNILVLTMALLVPFITYRALRRTHLDAHGMETFSGLWMQGILMFACGSIIFSATSYLFMRVVYPGFILDTLRAGVEFYSSQDSEAAAELAEEFTAIIDRRMYPNASTVAMMWLWLGTFTGSVLSLFEAMIVKLTRIPSSPSR